MTELLKRMEFLTNRYLIPEKQAEIIANNLPGKTFNIYVQKANLEGRTFEQKGHRLIELYNRFISIQKHEALDTVVPVECNLIKFGAFRLSRINFAVSDTKKTIAESTGETIIVETKNPTGRVLGFPELKVWIIFQHLYSYQMFYNKDKFIKEGKRIPFTYAQICRLLGIAPQGTNFKRVRTIIETMEDTKIIISHFYNKESNKIETTERFNIFSHSWGVKITYDKKEKREGHWVRINQQLSESIDAGYITTFNLARLLGVRWSIAFGLYLKLTMAFYGRPKGAFIPSLYYRYDTLCLYCRVFVKKEAFRTMKQFGPALEELVSMKFLKKYEWEYKNKKIMGIRFWPGALYKKETEARRLHLT